MDEADSEVVLGRIGFGGSDHNGGELELEGHSLGRGEHDGDWMPVARHETDLRCIGADRTKD